MKIVKKNLKVIIAIIITAVICISGTVYAAMQLQAENISYNDTPLDEVLDELYSAPTLNKFCELKSGTIGTVSSMYECTVGYENDTPIKYNFYLLTVNNDNSVDLIMDRNITQGTSTTTMTWNNAMKYIDNNLKAKWTNVLSIDLPKAQAIANAVGNSSWIAVDSGVTWWCLASKAQDSQSSPYCNTQAASAYNWIYDYTRECNGCTHSLGSTEAYGYWTRDLISNTSYAWRVARFGYLDYNIVSNSTNNGVRPVITVLKSSLYE